jgi:TonB-linked SusC/RagA family outer membrane protein
MNLSNRTVAEVLETIENETEFNFYYNSKLLNANRLVSVHVNNKHVYTVLEQLFNGHDVYYKVIDKDIILTVAAGSGSNAVTQNRISVSGTVIDADGEPVIGANVRERGTTNGTITDANGSFSLIVSPGATLEISYIGYTTKEEAIGNNTKFFITLEEDTQVLNEVVVVGYGTMRRKDVTGAMSSISAEKIDKAAIKSVDQMLQGRSSGLHMVQNSGMPGAGSTIRIRGGNSISGGNEPLYVIDGVPIYSGATGSQTDLNPLNTIAVSDIQSIEILKDASATAIYGARGANGVIMITTRQGKAGRTNVSFDTYWGLQNARKKYDLLNGKEFEAFANDARVRGGGTAPFDPNVTPVNTNWQDICLNKDAWMQNYAASVSGGDDKTRFLTTLNYMAQDGIVKGSDMQKMTLRANLDRDISSTVKMGLNLSLAQVNTNRIGNSILGYWALSPNLPVFDSEGNYNSTDTQSETGKFTNPLLVLRDQVNDNERFRTLSNVFVEWQIIKGLSFRTNFGVDLQFETQNSYTPLSIPAGESTKGSASIQNSKDYMWINENTLTYTNVFGKHRLNIMGALTQQSSKYQRASGASQGFLNDNLQMWDMGSGTNALIPGSSANAWSLLSYLGRINYNYNEKYLLTVSLRADGSSRFGKDNRWAYFPSAAIAWRASEEGFIRDWDLLNNLKFRASYGWTGNQDGIGVYPSMALLGKKAYAIGTTKYMGYAPTQVANYNLKWETTRQSDMGVEMDFFNNRLNLTADFYYKTTHDLLLQVQIPGTSGYRTGLKNVGKVENKGVELSLRGNPVNSGLIWDVEFNISFNKNKVLSLGGMNEMIPSSIGEKNYGLDMSRLLRVGEPLGIFYGYLSDGIFGTTDDIAGSAQPTAKPGDIRYVDISGPLGEKNNAIDEYDRVVLGNAQPKFFGGFTNTFAWKGFDLNIFMTFSYGNKIYNATKSGLEDLTGWRNQDRVVLNRWTETNQNTHIPRAVDVKTTSRSWDYLVEDGSYLRIQNINLGYSIPQKVLEWTRTVRTARLYVSLQNFFTFTRYSGLDPEVSRYGQTNVALGYDQNGYPMSKSVLFGANINF